MGKRSFLKLIMLFSDLALMYGSLFLAMALRHQEFAFDERTDFFALAFFFIFCFWILLLYIFDFYKVPLAFNIFEFLKDVIVFSILAVLSGMAYFYLQPQLLIAPKSVLVFCVSIFAFLFLSSRYFIFICLRQRGFREKVAIIGLKAGRDFNKDLLEKAGYDLAGEFKLDSLKDINKLKNLTEGQKINLIIFGNKLENNKLKIQKFFQNLPFNLKYLSFADFYEIIEKRVPLEMLKEGWLLDNLARKDTKAQLLAKDAFDILFSLFGIVILGLFAPFIILAIKMDSVGPVLYVQKRVGKNRKVFNFYKFRSMKVSTKEHKEPWREKDASQITRVGKILRRTHLDEMPQFINILKGDISFVGPRPEWSKLDELFEKKIPFYSIRYLVKPGVTGWAQLNFPPSLSVKEAKEKFEYDLYYIKNRSFFLDVIIFLKSFKLIFK